MPIDPRLSEPAWKTNGLSRRSTIEKLKITKTGVSEALRAYAAVGNLGLDHWEEKRAKLKAVKTVLAKCKSDHSKNAPFCAYINTVQQGLTAEVARLNAEINPLTVDSLLNNPAGSTAFLNFCRSIHSSESFEFLRDARANAAPPAIIATYINAGSPKELNINLEQRQGWIANTPGVRQSVIREIAQLLAGNGNELDRFKIRCQIAL